MNFLSYISLALGWIYVFLWSYSFYPMLYEIIKLKRYIHFPISLFSGVGVKIDY